MKNSNYKKLDLEECKRKINDILDEYNCRIETTDDYSWALLRDLDINETVGIERR